MNETFNNSMEAEEKVLVILHSPGCLFHQNGETIAGHSTISMTMNRYVHAQPEKIIDAGKKMHNLLAG